MFYYKNSNKKKKNYFCQKASLIKNIIVYIVLLFSIGSYSQSSIGIKLTSLSLHSKWNQDPAMFENKITKDGSVIMEPGYEINFQKFFYLTTLSLEIRQGIHSDAAAKMAGHFAIGIRWKFFHYKRHALSISLAPVYSYRENWNSIPQYVDDGIFVDNDSKQYKFLVGSELEYNIFVGKRSDISFTLMYNNSHNTLTFGVGYRFWINSFVNMKDDKCSSCGKRWNKGRFRKWWSKVWR